MKHLSKGTQQKVGVVQAFLGGGANAQTLCHHGKTAGNPSPLPGDILFLDEPLSGQDADSQQVFLRKASDCLRSGTTILLSCHEPHLVDRLADAVYTLDGGRLRKTADGAPRRNAGLAETDRLVFGADDGLTLPVLSPDVTARTEGARVILTAPCGKTQAPLLSMLQKGYALQAFQRGPDAAAMREDVQSKPGCHMEISQEMPAERMPLEVYDADA